MFLTWFTAAVAGAVSPWLPANRQKLAAHQPEALFTSLFILFFLSYNSVYAAKEFARFLLPVVPLMLFFWSEWIPRSRAVLWTSALASSLLTCAVVLRTQQLI